MTDIDLDKLAAEVREHHRKMSSGPWEVIDKNYNGDCDLLRSDGYSLRANHRGTLERLEDGHGIAFLRNHAAAIADALEELGRLRDTSAKMRELLARYRKETPAGHSPHMICHLVDEVLERTKP